MSSVNYILRGQSKQRAGRNRSSMPSTGTKKFTTKKASKRKRRKRRK